VTEPPDPDRARLDIDWASTPTTTDAEAVAVWRRILPTGVDWDLRLAQIPEDRVAPLAAALLRGGNFACAPLTGGGCTPGYLGWPDPAPDATFDEPCLRRAVALWAMSNLDGDQVAALVPVLRSIAGSPQVDDELAGAALVAAGDQSEATRLDLLRAAREAGHAGAVDDELGDMSEQGLITAATDLHIDAAIEALDVGLSRPVFLAAVRDRQLRPATRIDAIHELSADVTGAAPRDLEKLLVEAARDPDCGVAATAATTLNGFGKKDAMPRRPRTRKVADAMRALCVMAAADAVDAARPFVGPTGLKVIERTYDANLEFAKDDDDDADGDHDPRTSRTVETVTGKDLVEIPFDADIPAAMARCKGTVCALPGGVELTFTFAPARDGGLWLDAIERHDRGDCGSD